MPRLLISTGDSRSNNFNAIRLAMALLVVWSHCFALYFGSEKNEPISLLTNGHYNSGNVGVLVFFAISGFLISESYLKTRNMMEFFGKRIRRIYPGYLTVTLISAFLIVPSFSSRPLSSLTGFDVGQTIGLNLLLRNFAPTSDIFSTNMSKAINGSLWSIPFEFWCYIGVAALGFSRALNRGIVVSIVAVTILRISCDLMGKQPGLGIIGDIIGWPYLWLSIAPCFLLGTSAYLYRDVLPRSPILLGVFVSAFLLGCYLPIDPSYQKTIADTFFQIAMAYGVFYVAFSSRLNLHEAAAFGDFSYGTYLYAFPIQQMLFATFRTQFPFPMFVIASILLSLIGGIMSWHLIERWFLRKKPTYEPIGGTLARRDFLG